MRTTLTLDDDVYHKIEDEVRTSGKTYKEIVNRLLRRALLTRSRTEPQEAFKVRCRRLGSRPGLNYDNIGELIEQVEGPRHP